MDLIRPDWVKLRARQTGTGSSCERDRRVLGRVASETRREGSEQRRRSCATPSSGAPEQRSIATQIGPVRLRGRSVVLMRDTPMHTRELPLTLAPWALFRVLAQKEQPFFIDAGRPWGDEWVSSMGFSP